MSISEELVQAINNELKRTKSLEDRGLIGRSAGHPDATITEMYAILAEEAHELCEELYALREVFTNQVLGLARSVNEMNDIHGHSMYFIENARAELVQVMSVSVNIHTNLTRLREAVQLTDDENSECMD